MISRFILFHSLRNRIVFFFSILLLIVQGIAFSLVNSVGLDIAKRQYQRELDAGERFVEWLFAQQHQQLTEAAQVLAQDFDFQQAIASRDRHAILTILDKRLSRTFDLALVITPDNQLLADTLHPPGAGLPSDVAAALRSATAEDNANAFVMLGDRAYQLVTRPLQGPNPNIRLVLGTSIDDATAQCLHELSALAVSILGKSADGAWVTLATTHPAESGVALRANMNAAPPSRAAEGAWLPNYESHTVALSSAPAAVLMTILQKSTIDSLEPLAASRQSFLAMACISLGLSLLGSYFIARRITRPLNKLAGIADHIQNGDYSQAADIDQADEIGALAASINHMRDSVAEREAEILRLAYADTITGLPNRAMFNDRLEQAVKRALRNADPFTVLVLDLDRFKFINDMLGHAAGDQVLRQVGERLQAALRQSDTVARIGGDEFAILLATSNSADVQTVIDKIHCALEEPILLHHQPVDVDCSIGIASYPEHGEDAGTLLRHADVAMYVAKRTRSGCARYEAEHDEHHAQHLSLIGELRRAVEQDELQLYYQPKIDLGSARAVAVEALVRWQHPQRGFVSPAQFIPFAEQTGAIKLITRRVIDKAFAQCRQWLERGITLQVSLMSRPAICSIRTAAILANALQRNALPPSLICLEITESALLEDPTRARDTVIRLHELGLRLAIDDYGTGYSSLAYLKKLPVDELKIDRSFITNMIKLREDRAIVRSTIELGHNLGLAIVAEGVESAEECALLKQLHCDQAQGGWFSRPLSSEQLDIWLNQSTWSPLRGVSYTQHLTAVHA
ncbi:MAG: EAL domain-containing protein [Gammaproteobacteria bacterium]